MIRSHAIVWLDHQHAQILHFDDEKVLSGKKLKAEFNAGKHMRGTCSMARAADPDSGDSQFFICFEDAPFLDGQYTVWGEVIEGMEHVDRIKRGEPVSDPDVITSMTVIEAE